MLLTFKCKVLDSTVLCCALHCPHCHWPNDLEAENVYMQIYNEESPPLQSKTLLMSEDDILPLWDVHWHWYLSTARVELTGAVDILRKKCKPVSRVNGLSILSLSFTGMSYKPSQPLYCGSDYCTPVKSRSLRPGRFTRVPCMFCYLGKKRNLTIHHDKGHI